MVGQKLRIGSWGDYYYVGCRYGLIFKPLTDGYREIGNSQVGIVIKGGPGWTDHEEIKDVQSMYGIMITGAWYMNVYRYGVDG